MGSGASREVAPTGIKDVCLNNAITQKYMGLNQHGKVQAESLRCNQQLCASTGFIHP